jgi:hypothetical protein
MAIAKQFTASMSPGQVLQWTVWGAPYNLFIQWSVRPTLTGFNLGTVQLASVDVQAPVEGGNQQGPLSYILTIRNTGGYPVSIDAYTSLEGF